MSWSPHYTIRPQLLRTIRSIGEAIGYIQASRLSANAIELLSLDARALSSFASTSIEGNPLPLTDVKRLLKRQPSQIRDSEREVLNYNHALEWVNTQVANNTFEVSTKTFSFLQGMVTDGLMESQYDIGHIRKKPVVIRDPRQPDNIVFLPPDHQAVPELCDELMTFANEQMNNLDPILLAGLFHKQAVLIHPFMDGNGRSTRLMTTGLLGMLGIDTISIFSFEAYYNQNVTRYFSKVGEQGDYYDLEDQLDFTEWLEYFAEGILDELKRIQKNLPETPIRIEDYHQIILDYIDQHGSITQREYGAISTRSLAMRKKDFVRLLNLKLIKTVGVGRATYYVRRGNKGYSSYK